MWANGIGKEGGDLVVEDAGEESVSPPSYSFTDSNRKAAGSSALCWTLHGVFSERTGESSCRVGTADLSEQWNGESSCVGRSPQDTSGHPRGCFATSQATGLIFQGLALAPLKEKDQVCKSYLLIASGQDCFDFPKGLKCPELNIQKNTRYLSG